MGPSEGEIEFFKYSFFALQIIRLVVLVYYIFHTRKYIQKSERIEVDNFTKLTFIFLGLYVSF